jgi:hypothetical protein
MSVVMVDLGNGRHIRFDPQMAVDTVKDGGAQSDLAIQNMQAVIQLADVLGIGPKRDDSRPGIASQDYRDGKATGVAQLRNRLKRIESWGVKPTADVVELVAHEILYETGGTINADADS